MNAEEKKKARIIKAENKLKEKVGTGEIAKERIEATNKKIESTDVDFEPMALEFLSVLTESVEQAKKAPEEEHAKALQNMVKPVMDLKANAKMFGYPLVTELADVMLSFLDNIKKLDKDVIQIVDAHHKTLNIIVKSKMSGPVDEKGAMLVQELKGACKRYYSKSGQEPA